VSFFKWHLKVRAFVFEDNDSLRGTISAILESRDYEVKAFREPGLCPMCLDQGCKCPRNNACADLIITDLNMPNMTGLELLENRRRNGCKVQNRAVMSGAWTDSELERAKMLGCQVFSKPFRLDSFIAWLGECEKRIDPNRKLSDLPELNNNT